jgi:hypothetical protein
MSILSRLKCQGEHGPKTPRQKLATHTVIDDLGYVPQSREEMEVLFTILAERYLSAAACWSSGRLIQPLQTDQSQRLCKAWVGT